MAEPCLASALSLSLPSPMARATAGLVKTIVTRDHSATSDRVTPAIAPLSKDSQTPQIGRFVSQSYPSPGSSLRHGVWHGHDLTASRADGSWRHVTSSRVAVALSDSSSLSWHITSSFWSPRSPGFQRFSYCIWWEAVPATASIATRASHGDAITQTHMNISRISKTSHVPWVR